MRDVLTDLLYLCDLLFLFHYIGLYPARLAKAIRGITLIVGFSITAVVISLLYPAGLSMGLCNGVFHLLALAAFLHSWWRRGRLFPAFDLTRASTGCLSAAALLLLMLPKWIGGMQFSIFQGNQWDHFAYLQAAVGYALRPYHFFKAIGAEQCLQNPLWLIARNDLPKRPAIHFVFALTAGGVFRARMHELAYAFLVFALFQSILALRYMLRVIVNGTSDPSRKQAVLFTAIGMAFALGFWGQYVFDINAWSQLGSLSLMISLVATALLIIRMGNAGSRGEVFILAILASGCVYLYPESLFFHAPALIGVFAIAGAVGRLRRTLVAAALIAVLAGGLTGVLRYNATIGFGLRQSSHGLQQQNMYWAYFQRFLFGRGDLSADLQTTTHAYLAGEGGNPGRKQGDVNWPLFIKTYLSSKTGPIAAARTAELFSSLFGGVLGLYFFTPPSGLSPGATIIWSLLLIAFGSALIFGGIVAPLAKIRRARDKECGGVRALLLAFVALLAVEMAALLALRQFWAAGKALTFLEPYLVVLLLLPLAAEKPFSRRTASIAAFAAVYALLQLSLGVYRAAKAADPDGIHYSPKSYPSIQVDAINAKTHYKLASLEEAVRQVRERDYKAVEIRVSDIWIENYLMTMMTLENRSFLVRGPVRSYFSSGYVLGAQNPAAFNQGKGPDGVIFERWAYDPLVAKSRYILTVGK